MLQNEEVQQYFSEMRVKWVFNVEKAPWWGGVFEHMVRMTKCCLKKTMGRVKLTYDELTTLTIQVKASDDLENTSTPPHRMQTPHPT